MAEPPAETIVAVSSPPGRSARGLIRLSGAKVFSIVRQFVEDSGGANVFEPTPNQLTSLRLHHLTPTPLPILGSFFKAPASYTGDDLAELQLPGNPALLERAVQQCIRAGARYAQPGEFTFRAYLAGKLDLTEAEGIHATISARSDGQLAAAGMLREGQLGSFAESLVDELGDAQALTEAEIDFIDQEDVSSIAPAELNRRIERIARRLTELLQRSRAWGSIEALPRVVLVGPPSSGKSTLFNALLGRDRSVIAPTAGTTRDVLAEPMPLTGQTGQPLELMLVDIAGLDQPTSALDRQAQAAARHAIEQADLLLSLGEGGQPIKGKPLIRVQPKTDLGSNASDAEHTLPVSAVTGDNLDRLRAQIVGRLGDRAVSVQADQLALQPRHEAALRSASEHVEEAKALLTHQADNHQLGEVELLASMLRAALDELASLGGRLSPDQVIGRVFAKFCVGK